MSDVYEVVAGIYQTEAHANNRVRQLHNEGFHSAKVRKVNPDARPE